MRSEQKKTVAKLLDSSAGIILKIPRKFREIKRNKAETEIALLEL